MKRAVISFFSLGLAFASSAVFAGYEPWLRGPCREDAKKLCGEALAAGGDILACMRAHESKLSEGCKLGDVKKDCAADIEKFCRKPSDSSTADPAKTEVAVRGPRGCMRENLEKLSPACKAHFDAASARRPRGPKPTKTSTSLEPEASALAEKALLLARALHVDEPISPSERTMTLVLAMNTAKADESENDSAPTLTQSIFGFEEEIETNDPATRAAIERALRESSIKSETSTEAL